MCFLRRRTAWRSWSALALPVPLAPGLPRAFPGRARGCPGSAFPSGRGAAGGQRRGRGSICHRPRRLRRVRALPGPCEAAPSAAAALPCAPRWGQNWTCPEAVLGHCSALRQLPLQGHAWRQQRLCLRSRSEGQWPTSSWGKQRTALLCPGVSHNGALMVTCS